MKKKTIIINPIHYLLVLLIQLTEILEALHLYDFSIRILKDCIKRTRHNSMALYRLKFRLCYLLSQKGNYKDAINEYIKLLNFAERENFKTDAIIANLINVYNNQKQYDNAMDLIENKLDIKLVDDENNYIFYNIGNTYLNVGKYDIAKKYYLMVNFDYCNYLSELLFNVGLCHFHLKEYKESFKVFKHSSLIAKNNEERRKIHYMLGVTYLEMGEYIEAKKNLISAFNMGYEDAKEAILEVEKRM